MSIGSVFQRAARWVGGLVSSDQLSELRPLVQQINDFESKISALDDHQLKAKTGEFKERLQRGEALDALLPESFAVVREASKRELGMRHYDVQLIGGMGLHQGSVVEMKTGEGKTLVATLPSYLNALTGKGVHVVTVNDYLASRDADWMGRIHRFLGLDVGVVLEQMSKKEEVDRKMRRDAYAADITYVTNHELVFDFLRDNLATDASELVHRGQHFAIVDEVDMLLIDEVRTPLIISGPSEQSNQLFKQVDKVVRRLNPKLHYKVELKSKTASLTEVGLEKVEAELGVGALSDPNNLGWYHAVYQSVLAHGAYKNDVDYIVKSGQVQLIDEHTGRVSPDKRFSNGLHQALEAKEKLTVQPEDKTYARMSYQSYFRLYDKISGMTGTGQSEKREFQGTYGMKVLPIPTNKPIARVDYEDAVFVSTEEKMEAIVSEVKTFHKQGRPVLIGTESVRESEQLARRLKKKRIPCQVLNAKHHEREADIVAQAGRKGAVTISTNMAGRGTDILLGGNPDKLVSKKLTPGTPKYEKALARYTEECETNRHEVIEAGGLHVIGTSYHEASRLDDQLRGRAGRQGDPGSSQFILCLEDEIFLKFGEREVDELMARYDDVERYTEITEPSLLRHLKSLRIKVQVEYATERTETLKYDLIVNEQRNHIYERRAALLKDAEDLDLHRENVHSMIEKVVFELADIYLNDPEYSPTDDDLDELEETYCSVFRSESIEVPDIELIGDVSEKVAEHVLTQVLDLRKKREDKSDIEDLFALEREILLETIDTLWIEHLTAIERLEEGLDLVGYAQQDPLVIFRKKVGMMYKELLQTIRHQAVEVWFAIKVTGKKRDRRSVWKGGRRKRKG